jgi:hypothetical protein
MWAPKGEAIFVYTHPEVNGEITVKLSELPNGRVQVDVKANDIDYQVLIEMIDGLTPEKLSVIDWIETHDFVRKINSLILSKIIKIPEEKSQQPQHQ